MRKKLLHIMMGTHNPDFQRGLDSVFECVHFDWTKYNKAIKEQQPDSGNVHRVSHLAHLPHLANIQKPVINTEPPKTFVQPYNIDIDVLKAFQKFNPDIVFLHIQSGNVLDIETIKRMKESSIVFSWTGDIRFPLPQHYLDTGKYITSTLFTNMNDVETSISKGVNSDFLQVGFDSIHFNPLGEVDRGNKYPEIIFMGTNYDNTFPLSKLRYDMVHRLKNEFGHRFGVYGGGWKGLENGNITNYTEEGKAYRSCKIAINLSHFAYKRYSSDRMFRILGSGAFCLTHHFPDIEKDFKVGEELVVWNDIGDLVAKIKYYLANDNERGRIAMNGCLNARTNFTWHNFAINLSRLIKKYSKKKVKPKKNKKNESELSLGKRN